MSDTDDDGFLLYNPGVLDHLRDDGGFFNDAIAQFYALIAKSHGCKVSISQRRIAEAYRAWIDDSEHALRADTDAATTKLDHFKNAAFIAFWLRRAVPLNDINFLANARAAGGAPSAAQKRFAQYGNEICALFAGFYLCLAYETYVMAKREGQTGMHIISDAIGVRSLPPHFQYEYPRLMKQKSMSPHGLYMLYRSLFDSLDWDVRERKPAA